MGADLSKVPLFLGAKKLTMKVAVFGGQIITLDLNAENSQAIEFAYHQHECVSCVSPWSDSGGEACQGLDCTNLGSPSLDRTLLFLSITAICGSASLTQQNLCFSQSICWSPDFRRGDAPPR